LILFTPRISTISMGSPDTLPLRANNS
jgi:hypothetical protein